MMNAHTVEHPTLDFTNDHLDATAIAHRSELTSHRLAEEFIAGVPAIGDDKFWQMMDIFRGCVNQSCIMYGRTNGAEDACDELFRKAMTGESQRLGAFSYTMLEAIGFAKKYNEISDRIATAIGEADWDRGDDGFGDLCDSLPLLSLEFFLRAEGGEVRQETTIAGFCNMTAKVFADKLKPGEQEKHYEGWRTLVLRGENYFCMKLSDECIKRVKLLAVEQAGSRAPEEVESSKRRRWLLTQLRAHTNHLAKLSAEMVSFAERNRKELDEIRPLITQLEEIDA